MRSSRSSEVAARRASASVDAEATGSPDDQSVTLGCMSQ